MVQDEAKPVDRVSGLMERLLRDAGVADGMRVLDIGCGRGEVSLLLARLVGPDGSVLGLDRDGAALEVAAARARELGLAHLAFRQADLADPGLVPRSFDAVVGRRVLMYLADREAVVRALAEALRPGGLAVFQEADATMVPASSAPLPLHRRVYGWVWEAVRREGATLSAGLELPVLLERAGLVLGDVRAEAVVQTSGRRHTIAAIVAAVTPRIVQQGVASAAEIEVETLDQRLAEELRAAQAAFVGDVVFSAWARKPGP